MRFPMIEQVGLPVLFERYIPGRPHRDGRRYLPQLIFRLPDGLQLAVVDRHHYVDQKLLGHAGIARLILLLGTIRVQAPHEQRQGIFALPDERGPFITAPEAFGRVVALPSWEVQRGQLPYEQVYTELLLDVGTGVIGVRTSITAHALAQKIGTDQLRVGDWLHVLRAPRIDVLDFRAESQPIAVEPSH